MSEQFEISSYNLTLAIGADSPSGSDSIRITGEIDDLDPILDNPLPVEMSDSLLLVASAHNQMILEINPPRVVLSDVSGQWPARLRFLEGASQLAKLLNDEDLSIHAYAWNVEGLMNTGTALVMSNFFDIEETMATLGGDEEPQWFVPEIEFGFITSFANSSTLKLTTVPSAGEVDNLKYRINAHFEPADFDQRNLQEQGGEFTRFAQQMLGRLAAGRLEEDS